MQIGKISNFSFGNNIKISADIGYKFNAQGRTLPNDFSNILSIATKNDEGLYIAGGDMFIKQTPTIERDLQTQGISYEIVQESYEQGV